MKKIWTDPVWSKVIATMIIAVGYFILGVIYSLITDKTLEESLKYLWSFLVPIGPTFLVIIILLLITALIQRILKKQPSKLEKLEALFHKENTERVDSLSGVTFRYNARISSSTKYPFITDLRVYCTGNNHPKQLMKKNSGCSVNGCQNQGRGYNEYGLKTQIETDLLQVWDEMRN